MKWFSSALVIMLVLPACERETVDARWYENQKTIAELRAEIALAQFRTQEIRPPQEAPPALDRLHDESDSLKIRKRLLQREIESLQSGWETFQTAILRERRSSALKHFTGNLVLRDGTPFRDAKISRLDDTGVSLSHADGVRFLNAWDLSEEDQIFFGLDPERARIAKSRESNERVAYNQWADRQLAAHEKKTEDEARNRLREQADQSRLRVLAAASAPRQTSVLSSSIGALGETSASGFSSYRRSRYRYSDRTHTHYRYHYVAPRACVTSQPTWHRPTIYRHRGNHTRSPIQTRNHVFPSCP